MFCSCFPRLFAAYGPNALEDADDPHTPEMPLRPELTCVGRHGLPRCVALPSDDRAKGVAHLDVGSVATSP